MRIDGYLDERYEPPAPFVRATVLSKGLELRHIVNFHVDTGAAVTTLLDKDVKRLKIDLEKLKRAERGCLRKLRLSGREVYRLICVCIMWTGV